MQAARGRPFIIAVVAMLGDSLSAVTSVLYSASRIALSMNLKRRVVVFSWVGCERQIGWQCLR